MRLLNEKQKQQAFIATMRKIEIGCPNCNHPFCMTGNEYGNEVTPEGKYSPMARCPMCGILFTEGLDLMGNRWWRPMDDLTRMSEAAESNYWQIHGS